MLSIPKDQLKYLLLLEWNTKEDELKENIRNGYLWRIRKYWTPISINSIKDIKTQASLVRYTETFVR